MSHGIARQFDPVSELKSRWLHLKAESPGLRARQAAHRLGVSECELLSARCGDAVRRLRKPWSDLILGLPELGRVMSLVRNETAVHEKVGCFGKISIFRNMGLVLNGDIDLRIFLDHWHFGFAVSEETRGGLRHSLQFFDQAGTAVQKIYVREESNHEAYGRLVERFLHADQTPGQQVGPLTPPPALRPDGEIDRSALHDRWQALRDVHDFHAMLRACEVGRLQAFRLVGEDLARRIENDSFETALEAAAGARIPVMIFAGSPGVIQIHTGPVRRLREVGPWYNVLDPGFNLHLRRDHIDSAWVVRKPTRDGVVTSLEIFDAEARQVAWMFGERRAGEPEREDWRHLVARLEAARAQVR